jgi:hypothetical protein
VPAQPGLLGFACFTSARWSVTATLGHHDAVTAIWMEQAGGAWSLQRAPAYENERALQHGHEHA